MPAGGSGSAIVVERAGSTLVVRSADADAAGVGFAADLPPEPSKTTVVVDTSAIGALHALDAHLLGQLEDHLPAGAPSVPGGSGTSGSRWDMRLVATRTGRSGPAGAPPLAARLADRLGMGVVAPDGEVIALRGGELFSAGPGAGWLGFRQGSRPEWEGPRHPAPAWQAALKPGDRSPRSRPFSRLRSRDRRSPSASVTVTAVPAGLWVRVAGCAPLSLADLGFGVPVEPMRPVVLVGAPGEPVPGSADLAEFLESLPAALRETVVLMPYGQKPEACAVLAQSLADRLGIAVRAYHALPYYATDGTRQFAILDETGRPDRLSEAPEHVYLPGGAASSSKVQPPQRIPAREINPSAVPPRPTPDGGVPGTATATATAAVTTDRQGVLRPDVATGGWHGVPPGGESPGERPERFAASVPVAGAPPAPPTAFRATASTVVPESGPAARMVTVQSQTPMLAAVSATRQRPAPLPAEPPETVVTPPAEAGVPSPPGVPREPAEVTDVPSAAPDLEPEAPPVTPPAWPEASPSASATAPDAALPSAPDTAPSSAPEDGSDHRLWLADRVSTPEERQAFRISLGWRHDAAARAVARLLAERPGLRSAGVVDEALVTDLAAVRVFATCDQAEFVESVRTGGRERDRPFAACVASGLRRLPSLQGVVVRGGPADPSAADAYLPGQDLVEEAPLVALDAVDAHVPGAVEILIWSATARRLDGLAEGAQAAEVAFLPGTVFRVLTVDPLPPGLSPTAAPDDRGPVRRVLLTEVPPGNSRSARTDWADRILARLEETAATRATLPRPATDPAEAGRFAALPGDPARACIVPIGQRSMP